MKTYLYPLKKIGLILIVVTLSSCVSRQEIVYFQDEPLTPDNEGVFRILILDFNLMIF